jgi:hypothetical protein
MHLFKLSLFLIYIIFSPESIKTSNTESLDNYKTEMKTLLTQACQFIFQFYKTDLNNYNNIAETIIKKIDNNIIDNRIKKEEKSNNLCDNLIQFIKLYKLHKPEEINTKISLRQIKILIDDHIKTIEGASQENIINTTILETLFTKIQESREKIYNNANEYRLITKKFIDRICKPFWDSLNTTREAILTENDPIETFITAIHRKSEKYTTEQKDNMLFEIMNTLNTTFSLYRDNAYRYRWQWVIEYTKCYYNRHLSNNLFKDEIKTYVTDTIIATRKSFITKYINDKTDNRSSELCTIIEKDINEMGDMTDNNFLRSINTGVKKFITQCEKNNLTDYNIYLAYQYTFIDLLKSHKDDIKE